ncbi:MAG TPA: hypothetical protein VFA32_08755 [Dehalococcoidia bacterium]|jgi:hypothetical protein|nr:hypothetical protein [Dehalococcoidia bacterium]
MMDVNRAEGFKESAQRVEQVLEVVRAEMGKTAKETDWAGLARHFATGAAETKELALELASSQDADENNSLIHIFMLRQLEISLTFISKLSGQISLLQERVELMESDLAALKRSQ